MQPFKGPQRLQIMKLITDLEDYRMRLIMDEGVSQNKLDKFINEQMAGQRELHNEMIKGKGPYLDTIMDEIDKVEKKK